MTKSNTQSFILLAFGLFAVAYIAALFVPLPDNDSGNHASIALRMFEANNWAYLADHYGPYLDKPHFQFWLVALSFKLFGVGTVSYKISTFLFTLLGLWATYKLTFRLTYNKLQASYSVLILLSLAGYALSNIDIRMDAMLAAASITAVWQGVRYIESERKLSMVCTALFLAIAFGIKGWIGVAIPFLSLIGFLVQQKKVSWLISYRLPLLLGCFFLCISPILYAYYLQYDMHPELLIRGESGHSGLWFILFDQVAGRMGGEMGTSSASDPFFFFHSMLWSTLPFGLLFYPFLFKSLAKIKNTSPQRATVYALSLPAIFGTLLGFSLSSFKLPHYLNIVFPVVAIYLSEMVVGGHFSDRWNRFIRIMLYLTGGVMLVAATALNLYYFPIESWGVGIVAVAALVLVVVALLRVEHNHRPLLFTLMVSSFVWITLNLNVYPQIDRYQAGGEMARKIKSEQIPYDQVGAFMLEMDFPYSFDIYSEAICKDWSVDEIRQRVDENLPTYLLTVEGGDETLRQAGIRTIPYWVFPDYRITFLTSRFLNPTTRSETLEKLYLLKTINH